ncbi:MAG: DNA polymerase III subunit delta' [Chloroflexota bacterium]|nr:MAG: DNA polymerase III subunit delta' [Chloroflexota bacterium]
MNWNMIGHQWAVNLLRGHIAQDALRHAYLFTGPKGVGRRTLALRFAQTLNCPTPLEGGSACRTCNTCKRIERMQHPDLFIIQSKEDGHSLKVDQIRSLLPRLSLSAYEASYKVALLLDFEEATTGAANALLKTLEEPPSKVILILTAENSSALLETITSRCEEIRLRPVALEIVREGLERQWGIPAEQANLLAHISGGRPGYALYLHKNPKALEQRGIWLDDLGRLLAANRVERFFYAAEIIKDAKAFQNLIQVWVSFWRDVMLHVAGSDTSVVNLDRKSEIDAVAQKISLTVAQEMVNRLEKTQYRLSRYVNSRLTAEVLMLDLPHLE